jgi:hypothetical protein
MAYFAGLDVSVKETSVCIVDDSGKIVREARVASEPSLLQILKASPRASCDPLLRDRGMIFCFACWVKRS